MNSQTSKKTNEMPDCTKRRLRVPDVRMSGFVVKLVRCVWVEAVPGKKKLRIQKYPDTCRWTEPKFTCDVLVTRI